MFTSYLRGPAIFLCALRGTKVRVNLLSWFRFTQEELKKVLETLKPPILIQIWFYFLRYNPVFLSILEGLDSPNHAVR